MTKTGLAITFVVEPSAPSFRSEPCALPETVSYRCMFLDHHTQAQQTEPMPKRFPAGQEAEDAPLARLVGAAVGRTDVPMTAAVGGKTVYNASPT